MEVDTLIDELTRTVRAQRERAMQLRSLPADALLHHPTPGAWNALEILEHLCISSGIYLRGLERVFDERAARLVPNGTFAPGRWGEYFTRAMRPRPDGSVSNRMRTFRKFDPPRNQGASMASIDRFLDQCDRFLRLLERARSTDLNRMKVTSSLGPILRFKAGDAFRFPIAHQQRHFLQLERTLTAAGEATAREVR